MQANKPVEHQRHDSDSTQPKSVDNSLSSLPDLSKFGLSAPYPKTLIKQIAPETIVEEEVQQQPEPEPLIDLSEAEAESALQETVEEEGEDTVLIDDDNDMYDYKDPDYYVGADFRFSKISPKPHKHPKLIDDRTVWQHFWELAKRDNTNGFPAITGNLTEASKRNRKIAEKIHVGIIVTICLLYFFFSIFGEMIWKPLD